jgi:myo-inositol-1(or 4)-monophosphatase
MMTVANQRLSQASAIIEEAADRALHFFAAHQTVATHAKGVQDFVSEADTTVENFIRERLAAAFPGEAIVGEEFGGQSEGAYWIIDPIDGTSNFLRGSPLWGISLGFVRNGRPELGIVAMPVMGEIYAAADGTGLLMNGKPFARTTPLEDVRVMSLGDNPADDLDDAAELQIGLRRAGWISKPSIRHPSPSSLPRAASSTDTCRR